ncbi:MAG: hypothetical protein IT435_15395 [Phycisphaerales bacterium]|nr:hypothetical protein [Phycisphaerales bacterium]
MSFELSILLAQSPRVATTSPLLPTWLVIPFGAITLIALALHMRALRQSQMPPSRKRIRTVNGWLMLAAIPLLCYAFGFAIPSQARQFVLVWAASVGLVGIIVMLAVLDILNNLRLHGRAATRLQQQIDLTRLAAFHAPHTPSTNASTPPPPAEHDRHDPR